MPAASVSCNQIPCAPAELGADPLGRFCGDGTLIVGGAAPDVYAVIPLPTAVCRLATVPASFNTFVSAICSTPEPAGSTCLMIDASVSAVVVLLLTQKIFSTYARLDPPDTSAAAPENGLTIDVTGFGRISNRK